LKCRKIEGINKFIGPFSGTTAAVMAQRRVGRPNRGDFDEGSPEERRKPGRRPITEMQAEDESSLYFIIKNGKASLQVSCGFYNYAGVNVTCGSLKQGILRGEVSLYHWPA